MKFPLFISARPVVGLRSITATIGRGSWKVINNEPKVELQVYVNSLPVTSEFSVSETSKIYLEVLSGNVTQLDVSVESL